MVETPRTAAQLEAEASAAAAASPLDDSAETSAATAVATATVAPPELPVECVETSAAAAASPEPAAAAAPPDDSAEAETSAATAAAAAAAAPPELPDESSETSAAAAASPEPTAAAAPPELDSVETCGQRHPTAETPGSNTQLERETFAAAVATNPPAETSSHAETVGHHHATAETSTTSSTSTTSATAFNESNQGAYGNAILIVGILISILFTVSAFYSLSQRRVNRYSVIIVTTMVGLTLILLIVGDWFNLRQVINAGVALTGFDVLFMMVFIYLAFSSI